jgi:hypothetical protein
MVSHATTTSSQRAGSCTTATATGEMPPSGFETPLPFHLPASGVMQRHS